MDLLPYPIISIIASCFICLLFLVIMLNIFGLPGNWLALGLIFLWQTVFSGSGLDVWFWIFAIGLAVIGELLEFGIQLLKAKTYGSSSKGAFAGMVGAMFGAIMFAPLFWGLGALAGAVLGAWIGCFIVEIVKRRPLEEAAKAAFGTSMGRLLGTVSKLGAGGAIVAITANRIYPDIQIEGETAIFLQNGLCIFIS